MAIKEGGSFLDRTFHLSKNRTDVKTEIVAGVTTFMTTAYILAVNPSVLGATGMDSGSVFTATALASLIGTLLMAWLANYPIVLAPGMGLNAFFAYTVVLNMGYTWQMALAAVFIEGVLFIILSLTSVREGIFNAIPMNLKHAVSVGIGLFIAFIGLQNAKIVVDGSTLVTFYSFKGSVVDGTFHTVGITVLLSIIGILITAILVVKNVKGNMLWGILITWILGMVCQATGLYQPNPELGMHSVFPDLSTGFGIKSMAPTFMKMDFSKTFSLDFLVVMFAFLFVDLFDTLGTLIGVASKANLLDKDGKLPQIKGSLLSDAIATAVGAVFGTSTITAFVESAAGVAEGGRTGLTAVVAAILFGLSLFLSPIFLAIPSFATAPALIVVGFLMLTSIVKIDFKDYTEAIPAYITIIAMPFMYSISEGISMGAISYVVINVLTGKAKEKKISVLMYILAFLFVLKYILI
ncbi:NCS2 family permease [Clostridium sp. HBUAS56010]|uniref:NCS2 family permease n=1 Tax=Clostridium sp. HBUAS56010 TaxID=2571127 RepID=UPI001178CE4C|nr:NCS2 family permease [Clostridium sp. HBUAS56010]